ncbi:MAG: sensor histidine kinase [Candidatus Sericytochromatia bacterium]
MDLDVFDEVVVEQGPGQIRFTLLKPGRVCLSFSGVLSLALAQQIPDMLACLAEALARQDASACLLIDTRELRFIQFPAQRYLLSTFRFTPRNPAVRDVGLVVTSPFLRTLGRLFQRLNPLTPMRLYSSVSEALEEMALVPTATAPLVSAGLRISHSLPEYDYLDKRLQIRFYLLEPGIVLCETEGVFEPAGMAHLIETCLLAEKWCRTQWGCAYLISDARKVVHTTPATFAWMRQRMREPIAHFDLNCVVTAFWPQALQRLLRVFAGDKMRPVQFVATPAEALDKVYTHRSRGQLALPQTAPFLPEARSQSEQIAQQAAYIRSLEWEREHLVHSLSDALAGLLTREHTLHEEPLPEFQAPVSELFELIRLIRYEFHYHHQTLQQEIDVRLEAEQRAQALSQTKTRLLANVSHELRTPLHAILGFTQVLQKERLGPLNPRQHQFLERARENGLHLLRLIEDLLDLSRLESGHGQPAWQNVPLDSLLRQTVGQFEVLAHAKNLALVLELPDEGDMQVHSDPGKLQQIVINLISNAIKFTERGHVRLRLRAETEAPSTWLLSVSDTGLGIPLAAQQEIFEPFQRLEQHTQTGAGLGLAICQALCKQLGCTLSVSSQPGQGACFEVRIPRLPQDAQLQP